tara:strand:- start:147 stop:392 length:246 start_codon:yes stop_codon:yes gene_type:complete
MNKILYFTAPWCGPCRTFGPIIESSGLPIQKVNVDEDNTLSAQYGVRNVPTLLKIDSTGQEVGQRIVGVQSKESVINWYNG